MSSLTQCIFFLFIILCTVYQILILPKPHILKGVEGFKTSKISKTSESKILKKASTIQRVPEKLPAPVLTSGIAKEADQRTTTTDRFVQVMEVSEYEYKLKHKPIQMYTDTNVVPMRNPAVNLLELKPTSKLEVLNITYEDANSNSVNRYIEIQHYSKNADHFDTAQASEAITVHTSTKPSKTKTKESSTSLSPNRFHNYYLVSTLRSTNWTRPEFLNLHTQSSTRYEFNCIKENGYYGIENECNKFIECKTFVPSLYICRKELLFDSRVAWGEDPCRDSSTIQCGTRNTHPPTSQAEKQNDYSLLTLSEPLIRDKSKGIQIDCTRWQGHFPLYDTECSKYIRCEHGRTIIMHCPQGLVFSAELEACDWPANVLSCNTEVFHGFKCPAPETNEGRTSEKIVNFRYGKSCKKFIACQKGHPRLLSCDRGLSFSPKSQRCITSDFVSDCVD